MGDELEADERRRALAGYKLDDELLDAAAEGAFAMHDLSGPPRRGDLGRGPLRRAPADLGAGREPPPRPEGAARAAARARASGPPRAPVTPRERGSPGRSAGGARAAAAWRRARARGAVARLRRRGRGASRRRRLRGVRRRGHPRGSRARGGAQAQALLRPRPHARGAAPEPRTDRPAGAAPGGAVAGAPLRAPARGQARAGRRGAAADRGPGGLRARADHARQLEQWRYRNKLEYSFGTDPRAS